MRADRRPRNRSSQVVLGLVAIGLGILFLLDNLAIFNFRHVLPFWPLLLIPAGVIKMCDTRSRDGWLLGAVLTGVGVILLLNRWGFFYVSWHAVWPLALIGLGVAIVLRPHPARRAPVSLAKDDLKRADYVDVTAILGGFQRQVATQNLRGGDITAMMGGCELDLCQASITGEAVIDIFAVMGGVTIKCPVDWTVVLEGTPILAGFDDKTAPPPHDNKRLVVRGYAILGSVEIRN